MLRDLAVPCIAGNYDLGVGGNLDDCGCAYPDEVARRVGAVSLAWTQAAVNAASRSWLWSLPRQALIQSPTGQPLAVVCHGSPRRVNEYLYADRPAAGLRRMLAPLETKVVVCGHTHVPYVRELAAGETVVNCGSVGRPRHGRPAATYALLRWPDQGPAGPPSVEICAVPYEAGRAAAAVQASGLPGEFAELLLTGGKKAK